MLHEVNPEASPSLLLADVPTCKDGRVGAVEDDEFGHHLRVVNGKEPRHRPAPVMAHQTAAVVSLEGNNEKTQQNKTHDICYLECFLS